MTATKRMIETHPSPVDVDRKLLEECIDACFSCAQTCIICSDACLSEEMVDHMRDCVRTCDNCAAQCLATGSVVSRVGNFDERLVRSVLEACATVCEVCEEECRRHIDMGMEHCRVSADECKRCHEACRQLLSKI